ncbi:hypothetical protein GN956_G16474 [Arapaima gigas]
MSQQSGSLEALRPASGGDGATDSPSCCPPASRSGELMLGPRRLLHASGHNGSAVPPSSTHLLPMSHLSLVPTLQREGTSRHVSAKKWFRFMFVSSCLNLKRKAAV